MNERRAAPSGRDHQAFPELTEEQFERVRAFGRTEDLKKGTEVFQRGQRFADFFVIESGSIEIYDFDCDNKAQVFTVHGARQFTGEIDLFSDRKVLVGGRAGEQSRVVRLNRYEFRELLAAEPDIGDIVLRAFIVRRMGILEQNLGGALLIGHRHDPAALLLRQFLQRNGYPVQVAVAGEDEIATMVLKKHGATEDQLPMLLCHGEELLSRPSLLDVAKTVGIVEWPDEQKCYDLAIIGAGPGGMATAVYGASEGLSTVVLERNAPGGQAGTSSKIENYLGFPNGLSGQELAGRAQIQAQKFGATLALPMNVTCIKNETPPYRICVDDLAPINARTIVVATGATYRTLNLDNYERFEGRGIHYAATAIEAGLCKDEEIVVVGGGNSAGQAAIYLAQQTKHVYMLVRGDGLADSMSDYLIKRIDAAQNIDLLCRTEITELHGEKQLESIAWKNTETGEATEKPIGHIFTMIGAVPNTSWIGDTLYQDEKGFVCTGVDVVEGGRWTLNRPPAPFETSLPGVFAIGDVRANSVKRVASAVGEGSICVQFVHQSLASNE